MSCDRRYIYHSNAYGNWELPKWACSCTTAPHTGDSANKETTAAPLMGGSVFSSHYNAQYLVVIQLTLQRKHHLSWRDEHCSSCYTFSLSRLYLDNIGSKRNWAALCLFMNEMALLWCGRQLLEINSSFFSLL